MIYANSCRYAASRYPREKDYYPEKRLAARGYIQVEACWLKWQLVGAVHYVVIKQRDNCGVGSHYAVPSY
jgi:hypothetical protein